MQMYLNISEASLSGSMYASTPSGPGEYQGTGCFVVEIYEDDNYKQGWINYHYNADYADGTGIYIIPFTTSATYIQIKVYNNAGPDPIHAQVWGGGFGDQVSISTSGDNHYYGNITPSNNDSIYVDFTITT